MQVGEINGAVAVDIRSYVGMVAGRRHGNPSYQPIDHQVNVFDSEATTKACVAPLTSNTDGHEVGE